MPGAPALDEALGHAYRYLGMRDRTVEEMRRHLTRRAVAAELVEECVAELARQGYLDDERFAHVFAEDRRRLDGWGNQRIATRLQSLGVQRPLVEAAVEGQEQGAEMRAAIDLLRRRLRGAPADERERNRALGLLLRRGFELELAYDAVRRFERDAA